MQLLGPNLELLLSLTHGKFSQLTSFLVSKQMILRL